MDILLIALTIGLPLLKFIFFPARAMGRGGNWTVMGAVMIVAIMMALWFGIQSWTAPPTTSDTASVATPASDAATLAAEKTEIAALQKLL